MGSSHQHTRIVHRRRPKSKAEFAEGSEDRYTLIQREVALASSRKDGFVRIPRSFLTGVMQHLGEAELKTALAIYVETVGRDLDSNGIPLSKLERLTGMPRRSVTRAAAALDRGTVTCRQKSPAKNIVDKDATIYSPSILPLYEKPDRDTKAPNATSHRDRTVPIHRDRTVPTIGTQEATSLESDLDRRLESSSDSSKAPKATDDEDFNRLGKTLHGWMLQLHGAYREPKPEEIRRIMESAPGWSTEQIEQAFHKNAEGDKKAFNPKYYSWFATVLEDIHGRCSGGIPPKASGNDAVPQPPRPKVYENPRFIVPDWAKGIAYRQEVPVYVDPAPKLSEEDQAENAARAPQSAEFSAIRELQPEHVKKLMSADLSYEFYGATVEGREHILQQLRDGTHPVQQPRPKPIVSELGGMTSAAAITAANGHLARAIGQS